MTNKSTLKLRQEAGGLAKQFVHENQHQIKYLPPDSLKAYETNARVHSRKQVKLICKSIKAYGFTNPLLIDKQGQVVAGHGRLEAAKLLGLQLVPTVCLEHLKEGAKRAYMLADNKIAELATWDPDKLALEFNYLTEVETDFDINVTGFDVAEIDLEIQAHKRRLDTAQDDEAPEPPPRVKVVSKLGDLWLLDHHRLLCGDATLLTSCKKLMGRSSAQMVICDLPYNIPIDGNVSGLGRTKHREFVMGSGEMSEHEFEAFLEQALRNLIACSKPGSIHYHFMDWRHIHSLMSVGKLIYGELKNLICWVKDNAGMGSFYRSRHELVTVFKSGTAPHINNFGLGKRRHRCNVWNYPGVNTLRAGRDTELLAHPTPKPVDLVADAMLDCSHRGGIVLDTFAGSGTVLIAAEKTGRKAYAMELDAAYVDVAIKRWQKFTGKTAIHEETKKTFDQTAEARRG
jgi:DNA modification methylase